VRAIWEKQARSRLGEANQQLTQAEEEAAAALETHRRTVADQPENANPDQLQQRRLTGMATFGDATAAELIRHQADRRMMAAQGAWRRSAQELDIAEKLEERRRQAMAYVARRSAEATLDELMAMRRKHP
jgi:hypothetical protein